MLHRRAAPSVLTANKLPSALKQRNASILYSLKLPQSHQLSFPRHIHPKLPQTRPFHNGNTPPPQPRSSFWGGDDSNTLPFSIALVCGACSAYAYWAINQQKTKGDTTHEKIIQQNFILSLANYREGRWWTMLTSTIMHIAPAHLGANLFGLVSIGPLVVDVFGPRTFIIAWVGAGLCSSVVTLIRETIREKREQEQEEKRKANSEFPGASSSSKRNNAASDHGSLGASGSLFGLFTMAACYAPHMSMQLMMIPVSIPAWGLMLGSVGFSIAAWVNGWLPSVGHEAHLGGMAFGALYYFTMLRKRRLPRF
jgi:membrane associated rhomboid family serine protease